MSEYESSPPSQMQKEKPLFADIAREEVDQEIKTRLRDESMNPKMEASMLKSSAVRSQLLEQISKEYGVKESASMVRILERMSMSEPYINYFKMIYVKAALVSSFTIGKSIIGNISESRDYNVKKLVNEASFALIGLMSVARLNEFTTSRFSKNKTASEKSGLINSIASSILLHRKRVSGGDIHKPWGEFLELNSQYELTFPMRIGESNSEGTNFVYTGSETQSSEMRAKALSEHIFALSNAYSEMSEQAAENGQPIGFLDSENKRVVWDPDKHGDMPIALTRKINGAFKACVVYVPSDKSLSSQEVLKELYDECSEALNGQSLLTDAWKNPGEVARALFAFNLDIQDRLMSIKNVKDDFTIGFELRPMGVLIQGNDDDGKIQTEYVANHTATDGILADLLINGGKTRTRVRDKHGSTELVDTPYLGYRGFFNKIQTDPSSELHMRDENRYQQGNINIERCKSIGEDPEVIITRTIAKELGSDTMQSIVMYANEIFIDTAIELSDDPAKSPWREIPIASNNTHASKDNPFLRLVPASIYRRHSEMFKSLPEHYSKYNEVWSLLTSLISYKENRWLVDNYSRTQYEKGWNDHILPPSVEIMANITESSLPRSVKRMIFQLQSSPIFDKFRRALTYTQTIVTDKTKNSPDLSSLHKTVNNEVLPGVSLRQDGDKLGIVFNNPLKPSLMNPANLEAYSVLVTKSIVELGEVIDQIQKEKTETGHINLDEFQKKLVDIKAKRKKELLESYVK